MAKSNFIAKLKSIKHIEIILALVAVAVMLVIYVSSFAAKKDVKTAEADEKDYCAEMQTALEETIACIRGAGKTKVLISWESGIEAVTAHIANANGNSMSSSSQLVTDSGVTKPSLLKEIYPKALGVVIVCEGGDNVKVKIDIINAVCVLLDITPDKINVLTMKK